MTREAALDSQLLAAASRMATKQAQRLTTQFTVYDPVTFAQKAKTLMGGRTDDSVRGSGGNASGPSRRLPTVVICNQTAMTHNLPSHHQGAPSGKQGAGAFHRIIWPLLTSLLTSRPRKCSLANPPSHLRCRSHVLGVPEMGFYWGDGSISLAARSCCEFHVWSPEYGHAEEKACCWAADQGCFQERGCCCTYFG